MREYQEIFSPSESEVENALSAGDPEILKRIIIGIALHWDDHNLIESVCSKLIDHSNEEVRGNAILALGHSARRFGVLSASFRGRIKEALVDDSSYVRGQAWAAADDVKHFLGWGIEV